MSVSLRFFLGILLAVGPVGAWAQRAGLPAWQLYIQPLQLLFREAAVSYEWPVFRQVSFQAGVGYWYRNPFASRPYQMDLTTNSGTSMMFSPHLQAIKLSFGPVFYLNKSRSMYVQIDYFYRHWWVNDTRVVQDGYRYNFDVDRTERINVYGMKTLFGVTGNLGTLTPKTPLTYPAYAGVG